MKSHLAGLTLALAAVGLSLPASASAASSKFGLEYRVERADSGKLSLDACFATAKRASAALGYVPAVEQRHPGQLAVFASGPGGGGASLTVYCIAVDRKTAYVVQAIDYSRPNSPQAAKVANQVHSALLAAGR